jgi:hypothetical protein
VSTEQNNAGAAGGGHLGGEHWAGDSGAQQSVPNQPPPPPGMNIRQNQKNVLGYHPMGFQRMTKKTSVFQLPDIPSFSNRHLVKQLIHGETSHEKPVEDKAGISNSILFIFFFFIYIKFLL